MFRVDFMSFSPPKKHGSLGGQRKEVIKKLNSSRRADACTEQGQSLTGLTDKQWELEEGTAVSGCWTRGGLQSPSLLISSPREMKPRYLIG